MSGADLKKAIGTEKHIHPLEEVNGLPGELEKKFDKAGGTITGDMRVTDNARMKNLCIEEYLEVSELKYNRITATKNEFWVTDAGVIDDGITPKALEPSIRIKVILCNSHNMVKYRGSRTSRQAESEPR